MKNIESICYSWLKTGADCQSDTGKAVEAYVYHLCTGEIVHTPRSLDGEQLLAVVFRSGRIFWTDDYQEKKQLID